MDSMNSNAVLKQISGGLIVSVQADAGEPLGRPEILAALAQACIQGGAVGIRACQPQNLAAIRRAVVVPVIGLIKRHSAESAVYITPTLSDCLAVADTGCEIIALDATPRARPDGEQLSEIVRQMRRLRSVLLMADVATLQEGRRAAELGFDLISTTLAGYTDENSRFIEYEPDYQLVIDLVRELGMRVPIIAEGRIWQPESARRLLDSGAYAVVVGSAITRPTVITRRFLQALSR